MRKELFEELLQSVRDAGAIRRGEMAPGRITTATDLGVPHLDVQKVRSGMNLSQTRFAELLGISPRTLEGWEQRRRDPDGPARVLLYVAAAHPEIVLQTVAKLPKTAKGGRGGSKVSAFGRRVPASKRKA